MLSKDGSKSKVLALVRNYLENQDKLRTQSEFDTRTKFIDRMFEALGWDVFGEVIPDEVEREQPVKTRESGKKKADYTFKINGITRLIVEAKAVGEDIENEVFETQAITYAFNRACSWAVLTNFISTRVFFVDIKGGTPFYRIDLATEGAFNANFETLWYLSKESILANALEAEAKRRGFAVEKIKIDKQLLDDLRAWRELLSSDIKRRQPNKYEPQVIDEIVQKIIDRVIFVRKAEDSQLEEPVLEQIIRRENTNTYGEVKQVFERFRETYDSKLFGEGKGDLHEADKVELSNQVIEKIIRGTIRPPNGRVNYDFDSIDADVLGAIYEQYLAYILSQTPSKVRLEGGILHRKEQGIYYTPTYIVGYIVRNTLGELLKQKRPQEVDKLKVLDPACGSGSFLIKTYDALNSYYQRRDTDGFQQTRFDATTGATFARKVHILQNNIFGVDLDSKAVEITQLNLLMKIAERGHRLPVLQKNIRCGDSLIYGEEESYGSTFNFEQEFSEVMADGGFDVIIGNPPYVRPHNLESYYKELLWKRYSTFKAKSDLYNCFMERGIGLLKNQGLFSFIVPKTWTSLESFYEIRRLILSTCRIVKLVQLPKKVFADATVETCIFILKKEPVEAKREHNEFTVERLNERGEISTVKKETQSRLRQNHLLNFGLYVEEAGDDLLNKIKRRGLPLESLVEFFYGLKTGDDEKFLARSSKGADYKKLLRSKDIKRYAKSFDGEYVWYVPELMVENKRTARPGDKERFESEKVIVARMGQEVVAVYDDEEYYVKDAMLLLKKVSETNLKAITAILNSKVINYYYGNYFITIDVLKNALLELPIAVIDSEVSGQLSRAVDKVQGIKEGLLGLGDKDIAAVESLKEAEQRVLDDIDGIVYEMYRLTPEERETIEKWAATRT